MLYILAGENAAPVMLVFLFLTIVMVYVKKGYSESNQFKLKLKGAGLW